MTRNRASRRGAANAWQLRDAKEHFSDLVRRAKVDGPQLVTVHGRDEVVVVAADEFRRLKGEPSGRALVELLHRSPLRSVDFDRKAVRAPVRRVDL